MDGAAVTLGPKQGTGTGPKGTIPMGTFSWQMVSCTLEQLAASRETTQPFPGARVPAPPRLRAPSTGYKVEFRLGPLSSYLTLWVGDVVPEVSGLTVYPPLASADPAFVASAYVPESLGSPIGDDDKIYFFFSETGQEFEFFENTIVSRVARVCKVSEGKQGHPPKVHPHL